jgi:hypothetical protein
VTYAHAKKTEIARCHIASPRPINFSMRIVPSKSDHVSDRPASQQRPTFSMRAWGARRQPKGLSRDTRYSRGG